MADTPNTRQNINANSKPFTIYSPLYIVDEFFLPFSDHIVYLRDFFTELIIQLVDLATQIYQRETANEHRTIEITISINIRFLHHRIVLVQILLHLQEYLFLSLIAGRVGEGEQPAMSILAVDSMVQPVERGRYSATLCLVQVERIL